MTVRKFSSPKELKDDEYLYWQGRTPAERFSAAFDMSIEGYKEWGYPVDGSQLKRVAVRIQRALR